MSERSLWYLIIGVCVTPFVLLAWFFSIVFGIWLWSGIS